MFCKNGVLKNFTKSTGKHLCQSLFFNEVEGLTPATLLKKRFWHICFPVNFVKFLSTLFLLGYLWRLLLKWGLDIKILLILKNCNEALPKINVLEWLENFILIVIYYSIDPWNEKKNRIKFSKSYRNTSYWNLSVKYKWIRQHKPNPMKNC